MKDLSWSLPDTDFHETLQSAQEHLKVTMDLGLGGKSVIPSTVNVNVNHS